MKKLIVLLLMFTCMVAIACDAGTSGCGDTDPDARTDVTIKETTKYIQIDPVDVTPKTGLIYYPGAMIAPADYTNPLQSIAAAGYRVLILKPTMNLAIMSVGMAANAAGDFDDIENWVIGGHSLGGVAAIKAILQSPATFKGLALMASYPDTGDDLTNWNGAVLSISAENDGLTSRDDIEQSKALLPDALVVTDIADFPTEPTIGQTLFYEIAGGNHAQFGDYGVQNGDGEATITQAEQHEMIIELVVRYLQANNW